MQFRKTTSRIALGLSAMLVLVGAAAAVDVLPWWGDDELVATLVAATITAWLTFALSFLLDRPAWRGATIGLLCWLPLPLLALMFEVWGIGHWLTPQNMLVLSLLTAPVVVGSAALRRLPSWRSATTIMLGGVVAAHILQWAILLGDTSAAYSMQRSGVDPFWTPASVGASIALFGLSASGWNAAWIIHRSVSLAGAICAAGALFLRGAVIVESWRSANWFWGTGILRLMWAFALLACGLPVILSIPMRGWASLLRWSAALALVLLSLGVAGDTTWGAVSRVAPPFGLVILLGSLLGMGAIELVRRSSVSFAKGEEITGVDATCPRCRAAVVLALGSSACAACGLRFRLQVEEPRCAGCGYALRGIQSASCPECGRAVRQVAASASA